MSNSRKKRTAAKSKADTIAPPAAAPVIECPSELGPTARKVWDKLVPPLSKSGLLTPFDEGQLAIYCTAYSYWLEATEALQKYGTMIKSPNGYPVQSPYVSIANKNAEIMMKIADEYGFLPAGHRWRLVPRGDSSLKPLDPEDRLQLRT